MKTTKRLFSWLIVLAMVISMIPAFDLPTFAATEVEEEAAEPVRFPSDVETYEAECPVCKTTVTWKPYNGEHYSEASGVVLTDTNSNAHFHLYLTEDKTFDVGKNFFVSYRTVCFNLNGYNVTSAEGNTKPAFMCTKILNMIDTFGGSVVTGSGKGTANGAAIHVNGGDGRAVTNLYGGTYKKLASDNLSSIVRISTNGGTINMYEGVVIDGTGTRVDANTTGGCVGLAGCVKTSTNAETGVETKTTQYATFNMYGGEIKNGSAVSGGNVEVGVYHATNKDCAVFNMYGGKVSGGTAFDLLKADGTVSANGAGGNFSVHYGGVLNISGGTIANGHVASDAAGSNWGGNIRAYTGNVNISGGLIYGGTGGKQLAGANVSVYSDDTNRAAGRGFLTISGGTIVGDVATSKKNSVDLTISGSPKIVKSMEIDGETVNAVSGGLLLVNGAGLDVSKLNADAEIAISGVTVGSSFTAASENAAAVAGCFTSDEGKLVGKAHTDNTIFLAHAPVAGAANLPKEAYAKVNVAVNNTDAGIDGYIKNKTCPMCGATNVTWTANPTGVWLNGGNDGKKVHYVFDKDLLTHSNFVQMANTPTGTVSQNNTVCIALKSTATITCDKYRVQIGGTNNVVNIMGTGTLKADQTAEGATDLGLFQMDSGTLNLYGGTFLHEHKGTSVQYAVVRVAGASTVVNIYKDAKIGPATEDNTKIAMNVYQNGGTVNMYGGEIRNGIAFKSNTSANVNVVKGTFNMYGGKIIGGNYQVDEAGKPVMDGDTAVNGTVSSIRLGAGTFNMYGGTIEGGLSKNGGNGGAVYGSGNSVLNLMGGTITGGQSTSYGGNLAGWNTTVNISGTALIEKGYAPSGGGNIYIPDSNMIVNITGGYIRDGEAKFGGNISMNVKTATNTAALNISGGEISGGTATGGEGGGNIYQSPANSTKLASEINITGGTIKDGKAPAGNGGNIMINGNMTISGATISGGSAKVGGNINLRADMSLTIAADAQILDGEAVTAGGNINTSDGKITTSGIIMGGKAGNYGGNISIGTGAEFTMNGGVLANGTLTNATTGSHWGGNIRSWNGKIVINDGLVYGGGGAIANVDANNIGALGDQGGANRPVLTINGGTIVGDISTSAIQYKQNAETGEQEVSFPGTQVILTGAPQIVKSLEVDGKTVEASNSGILLANMVQLDISGLTNEANIVVEVPYDDSAFTQAFEGAAELVDVFTPWSDKYVITLGEDNIFYNTLKAIAIKNAKGESTWYTDVEEAVAAYYAAEGFAKKSYLVIGGAEAITLAGDAYVDINGKEVAIDGTGKLYGLDSFNDTYTSYGKATVAETIEVAAETKPADKRYIAVNEGEFWGFHRLSMWMSDVTLRTSNPGMYYKAAYQCDSVLRDAVESYGVALSLNAVPTIDFANEAGTKYTQYGNETFAENYNSNHVVNTNSGAIVGILKERNSQETNAANLQRVVYSNAYITFSINGGTHTVIHDSINAGKNVEDEDFASKSSFSLAQILIKVNENWDKYSEEDQATIQAFILEWVDNLPNETVMGMVGQLGNIFPAEA